jgi:hypothetical protein
MQIVISDSSCLIDLHKAQLLTEIVNLPFTFAIPQPLFDDELDSIPVEEKQQLLELGMQVIILPGEQVSMAQTYSNQHRQVSLYDCFALVVAEVTENSTLFTGDKALRALAESKDIETHGVLWAIDMLEEHSVIALPRLVSILEQFLNDPLVRLPEREVKSRIRRMRRAFQNDDDSF